MKYLIIVESPAKIEKIKALLGSQYEVISSLGHIMDLDPLTMALDFDNDFAPTYKFYTDIRKVANNKKIKELHKKCDKVIIAADLDREGEFIGESIKCLLKLKTYDRIVFNEITKKAIDAALLNPIQIDYNKIHAQQTRRFMDRIFGFCITDLLKRVPELQNRNVKKLGCGRVQSIITKIIVDREKEIDDFFKTDKSIVYSGNGQFSLIFNNQHFDLNTTLYDTIPKTKVFNVIKTNKTMGLITDIITVLASCTWKIVDIKTRIINQLPKPPHVTSTLQCEASSDSHMHWPIKKTMDVAQQLYEKGYITYMRTDSTILSDDALNDIEKTIKDMFGNDFHNRKQYVTQSESAQEAHEAIRPTCMSIDLENMTSDMEKLYNLIWRRAMASQMAPAQIESSQIFLGSQKHQYLMSGSKSRYLFKGYVAVLDKNNDEEDIILSTDKKIYSKATIIPQWVKIKEGMESPPSRYNEAQMVKHIVKLQIGRPSTFVDMVNKIQIKDYVRLEDVEGQEKMLTDIIYYYSEKRLSINDNKIFMGKENKRLVPTSLGIVVNNFMVENFPQLMGINFSADLEKKLDKICNGQLDWTKTLHQFYDGLKPQLETYRNNHDVISGSISTNMNDIVVGTYNDCDIIFIKTKKCVAIKCVVNGDSVWVSVAKKPNEDEAVTLIEDKIKNVNQKPATTIIKTIGKYTIRQGADNAFIQTGTKKSTKFFGIYDKELDLCTMTAKQCKEICEKSKKYKKIKYTKKTK